MKRFLQTGYLLPLAVAITGFATAASGIVDQTWLRWTAAGLGLLVGVVGVGAKFRGDQRSDRQRLMRRCMALRAALEQLLEAAGWLPDYFPEAVRLGEIEQRVRVSTEIRRDLEVESAAPGIDIDVDAERRSQPVFTQLRQRQRRLSAGAGQLAQHLHRQAVVTQLPQRLRGPPA